MEAHRMLDSFTNNRHRRLSRSRVNGCQFGLSRRDIWLFALLLASLLLAGCAGAPTRQLQQVAERQGMEESVVESERFSHRLFRNNKPLDRQTLNVYLEGDGLPWMFRYFVVSDPTPRWPLMLNLMALDESSSVYIGRPCYNGFARQPGCEPTLWTSARYSKTIVNSMAEIIIKEIDRSGAAYVNLFGHSGGGALALLLAEQFSQTRTVVTIAGNIDIDGWTRLHGYSPLEASLNPVLQPALDESIIQVHLLGGSDKNIPPSLALDWITRQSNTYGVVYEGYTHSCCWTREWRRLVRQVGREEKPIQFRYKPFKLPDRRFLFASRD